MPARASNTGKTPDVETQDGTIKVDVSPSKTLDWLIGRRLHFISTVERGHVLVNVDIEHDP